MAKITSQRQQNVKDIVNRNRDYMTGMHDTAHVKFLDTAPVFITLYTQDLVRTTSAIGFKDSYKDTGANSPIRYNKVNNFPIFLSDKVSRTTEKSDDIGWGELMSSSAIALPKTVSLNKDDLFVVEYSGQEVWFKISGAPSVTKVKSNDYQYFEFELKRAPVESGYTIDTVVDPAQIVDEYECLFDNVGTEFKTIIRKTESELISLLLNKADEINAIIMDEAYFNNSYRRNLLLVETDCSGVSYIHPLSKFANDNEVLTLNNNIWMMNDNDVKFTRGSLSTYNNSIFKGITTRDHNKVGTSFKTKANNINDVFFSALNNVIDTPTVNVIGYDGDTDVNILVEDAFSDISDSTLDKHGYTCIMRHMRGEEITTDDLNTIETEISSVEGLVRSVLTLYVIQTRAREMMYDNTLERII